jgi:hypothetical protein
MIVLGPRWGLTGAPGTEAIMSVGPKAEAGVGTAVDGLAEITLTSDTSTHFEVHATRIAGGRGADAHVSLSASTDSPIGIVWGSPDVSQWVGLGWVGLVAG